MAIPEDQVIDSGNDNGDLQQMVKQENQEDMMVNQETSTQPITTKTWLIIGGVVIILAIAAYFYFKNKNAQTATTTPTTTGKGRNKTYVYIVQEGASSSPPGITTTPPSGGVNTQTNTTTPSPTPSNSSTPTDPTSPTSGLTPAQKVILQKSLTSQGFTPSKVVSTRAADLYNSLGTNSIPSYKEVYGGLNQNQRNQVQVVASTASAIKRGITPNQPTKPDTLSSLGQTSTGLTSAQKALLAKEGYSASAINYFNESALKNPNAVIPGLGGIA